MCPFIFRLLGPVMLCFGLLDFVLAFRYATFLNALLLLLLCLLLPPASPIYCVEYAPRARDPRSL